MLFRRRERFVPATVFEQATPSTVVVAISKPSMTTLAVLPTAIPGLTPPRILALFVACPPGPIRVAERVRLTAVPPVAPPPYGVALVLTRMRGCVPATAACTSQYGS